MHPASVLRQILIAHLGYGALVACLLPFPFLRRIKAGDGHWFVLGCFIAVLLIRLANCPGDKPHAG